LKAIENIVLPRLLSELNYIRVALDERERSDHNRLKIAKDILKTKRTNTISYLIASEAK
jgi:vacuolar-type H+-ATPase subunit D/Vma8